MGDNVKVIGHGESKHKLQVGNFCSIAENVTFYLHADHRKDFVTTFPFKELGWGDDLPANKTSKGDIIVGNDVWIGRGASIMSGIRISDGAIIGAHAVVTRDVASYEIVAGNPAEWRGLRHFSHKLGLLASVELVEKLREIAWWNWPDEKIRENLPLLLQSPEAFIEKHYSGTQPTPTR